MANKLQGYWGRRAQCPCNFICSIKKNQFAQTWFRPFLLEWEWKQILESFHFKVDMAVKLSRFKNIQSWIRSLLSSELQKDCEKMRRFTGHRVQKRQLRTFYV